MSQKSAYLQLLGKKMSEKVGLPEEGAGMAAGPPGVAGGYGAPPPAYYSSSVGPGAPPLAPGVGTYARGNLILNHEVEFFSLKQCCADRIFFLGSETGSRGHEYFFFLTVNEMSEIAFNTCI